MARLGQFRIQSVRDDWRATGGPDLELVGCGWKTCYMTALYTKNGRPLWVSGDSVYARSVTYVGRTQTGKLYSPSGTYIGTIVGDRVVHRGTDSGTISAP